LAGKQLELQVKNELLQENRSLQTPFLPLAVQFTQVLNKNQLSARC
jgi:hypothetical protein